MTQYLFTVSLLFMTILCMLFLTATNQSILLAHKKGFFVAFLGEVVVILFEILSIFLNGSAVVFKPLHFLANYAGFLLSPILIVFFATSIGRFHRLKWAMIGSGAYFILYNILVATKRLFSIDSQNVYHRDNLFFVYVVAYLLSTVYLLYETLRYSREGFSQHRTFAYLLCMFFLISCCFQMFKSEIYTTRIAVVLNLCLYYSYNISLTDLFDKLTGTLNQSTYLKKIKELKEGQIVVILDIDDFKDINDTHGHQYGDNCLKIIAQAIKDVFENYGQCYRVGGDEFAILLRNSTIVENLIARFERMVAKRTENLLCKVSVSIGYCKCENSLSYEEVVQRADLNMYNAKNQKKALRSTK